MALQPGAIIAYGSTIPPNGWLLCNGQEISRQRYSLLFHVIGTTYGAGNGSTTFNLPNLKQRFPLGKADSGTGAFLGESGGMIDHFHTINHHQHVVNSHAHPIGSHVHTFTTGGGTSPYNFKSDSGGVGGNVTNHTHIGTTGPSPLSNTGAVITNTAPAGGGNTTISNPPYLVVNYIIKVI